MTETLAVSSERVDDIPLLLAQLEHMGVLALLDEHFPTHGNWQGLSLGWVAMIWLTHILSEGDHRLSHVQTWADQRLETLSRSTGKRVRDLDFSDDRLGDVLRALSDDGSWEEFESTLNRRLMRVYDLDPQRVRLDSTTASGYWSVTSDGMFQFGHSKALYNAPGAAALLCESRGSAASLPNRGPTRPDACGGSRTDCPRSAIRRTRSIESCLNRRPI